MSLRNIWGNNTNKVYETESATFKKATLINSCHRFYSNQATAGADLCTFLKNQLHDVALTAKKTLTHNGDPILTRLETQLWL